MQTCIHLHAHTHTQTLRPLSHTGVLGLWARLTSTCIAHTLAILLHNYSAMHDPPPTPRLYVIHHTMLIDESPRSPTGVSDLGLRMLRTGQ